ncbi:YhbY family RNA-binding protein [Methylomonas sp. BW4-1]|uniref:YhbY family RNA-binding protein n=1 Tax=Methylomonas sp. BW4-1 TaxID=3376685 RepID=UPI0040410E83
MNPIQKKKLKAEAHPLNPVVIIGQAGLTEAVIKEINVALDAHEADQSQNSRRKRRACGY